MIKVNQEQDNLNLNNSTIQNSNKNPNDQLGGEQDFDGGFNSQQQQTIDPKIVEQFRMQFNNATSNDVNLQGQGSTMSGSNSSPESLQSSQLSTNSNLNVSQVNPEVQGGVGSNIASGVSNGVVSDGVSLQGQGSTMSGSNSSPESLQSSQLSTSSNLNVSQVNPEVQGGVGSNVASGVSNGVVSDGVSLQGQGSTEVNDEDLLKEFVGKNYEKITTRPFNIAGFFFTTGYMFYRKMFGYALLALLIYSIILNFALSFVNNFIVVAIAFHVLCGFLVNKIYLFYAKKKIAKIKSANLQKNSEELKKICSTKGGTSIGKVFLGFLAELGIVLAILVVMMLVGFGGFIGGSLGFSNLNSLLSGSGVNTSSLSTKGTLVEDVTVSGFACINSNCTVSVENKDGDTEEYVLGVSNSDLINSLSDYKKYIKLNIYYTSNGKEKTIVDYKIFLKSNNDDISDVKDENELRNKIGLYTTGTHTDSFTLSKIGTSGIGFNDANSYTYTTYTFVNSKNVEYEMKYLGDNVTLNLVEGNKYNVTFEASEDTFGYEFIIKSIN